MKTVKIQGGLGNQLFCLAFAGSLARLSGETVAADVSAYAGDRFGQRFALEDLVDQTPGLKVVRRPLLGNRLISAAMRRLPAPAPGFVSERPPMVETPGLHGLARRSGYFDGYWQDERFIVDGDAFCAKFRAFVEARRSASDPPAAVVIHYRTYGEENHPVYSRTPPAAYFQAAMAALESRGVAGDAVLVSDDPPLAMSRLGDIGRRVTPVAARGWADDMALILGARALILSNSSFSWWGGYAGRAEAVVYPAKGDLFHYPSPARRFLTL